jgi:predicted nucleic acid-binding protein
MKRLFIDSSVFFSAAYSSKGHSRDLVLMAARGEVLLVVSNLVLEEVRRNLMQSAPQVLPVFDYLLEILPLDRINPIRKEVVDASKMVELKDAPIVAAAKKAQVDMLVTLDKKHLLDKPEIAEFAGLPVVTPQQAVMFIRGTN